MARINYNVEEDEVLDVLNYNDIPGLSHAEYERKDGKQTIVLYILDDDFSEDSQELVEKICFDFGETYRLCED
jgi:hypothetical protein